MRFGVERGGREEELVVQTTVGLDRSPLLCEDVIVLLGDVLHVHVQDLTTRHAHDQRHDTRREHLLDERESLFWWSTRKG